MAMKKNAGATAPAAKATKAPTPKAKTVSPDSSSVPADEAAIIEQMKPMVTILGTTTATSIDDYIKIGALACRLRDVLDRKEKPKPKPQRRKIEDVLHEHFGSSASTIYRLMRFGEDKTRKIGGVDVPTGPSVIRAAIASAQKKGEPLPAGVLGLDEFQRQYNRATVEGYDAALKAQAEESEEKKAERKKAAEAKVAERERDWNRHARLVSEYRGLVSVAVQMLRNNDIDPTPLLVEKARIESADLAVVVEGDPCFEVVEEIGAESFAARRVKIEEEMRHVSAQIPEESGPAALEGWRELAWRARQFARSVIGPDRGDDVVAGWAAKVVGRDAAKIAIAMRLGNLHAARAWAREQAMAEAEDFSLEGAETLKRLYREAKRGQAKIFSGLLAADG